MLSTKISPFTVSYENSEEFHVLKNEIFTQDAYYFESENPTPVVIDAGAHIGLATLYFKKLFPAAHITAIEPNPLLLPLLEQNVNQNALCDVTIVNSALSEEKSETELFIDQTGEEWWSTGSFEDGAWNHQQTSKPISVSTLPLADFLTQPVDFLKLDIEGVESKVLAAAGGGLKKIKQMMIEFHPTSKQDLGKLIELLQQHGFSTLVWKDGNEITIIKKATGLVYIEAHNKHWKN